jgi:hypothetical protein
VIPVVLDKLIYKAIQGEKFHSTEVTILSAMMFAAGALFTTPTPATGYTTPCEDLEKNVVHTYNGSIDEYREDMFRTDLYASSTNGSMILASSSRLEVVNGTRLDLSFKQRISVTCNDGRIHVSSFIHDTRLEGGDA